MTEKEGISSTLGSLLDHIPALDGGGRRRLTAGTIVVLTVLFSADSLPTAITRALSAKDISFSLLLATSALLIYATGVLVELIGEVFLARAVSNVTWSYVHLYQRTRSWSGIRRYLAALYIGLWGTFRAPPYFIYGLIGGSVWSIALEHSLSADAHKFYTALPLSVRSSIEKPLGKNSDFGRRALIDQIADADTKRWARRLMGRPEDVLAIVSAIVCALVIVLFTIRTIHFEQFDSVRRLEARRSQLFALVDEFKKTHVSAANAAHESPGGDIYTSSDLIGLLQNLEDNIATLIAATREPYTAKGAGVNRENLSYSGIPKPPMNLGVKSSPVFREDGSLELPNISTLCDNIIDHIKQKVESNNRAIRADKRVGGPGNAEQEDVVRQIGSLCASLNKQSVDLPYMFEDTQNAIAHYQRVAYFSRLAAAASTLFLYLAFFSTLRSATISVIEMLALKRLGAAQSV